MTVYIVTLNNGFFGSAGQSWRSLDIDCMKGAFEAAGFDVVVTIISDLLSFSFREDDVVVYTSSEQPVVRGYIKDVMYLVSKRCSIFPSYQNLMAHENKGFQQMLRDQWEMLDLQGHYYYDLNDVKESPPFVLKSIDGAGSSGVRLIKSACLWKFFCFNKLLPSVPRFFKGLIRRYQLTSSQYSLYEYRYRKFSRVVVQEFVSDVKFDYKVLFFYDKFYVLRRGVKPNDFRASGAGMLSFPVSDVPDVVFDLALKVVGLLDTPIASLDIICKNGRANLVEFQVTNFGPKALIDSPGYFVKQTQGWSFVSCKSDLNHEISRSFVLFVKEKSRLNRDCFFS